jgi:hypothetical protein
MPSVRPLDATFLPRNLRFGIRSVRVGFVANEVSLARVLLGTSVLPCQYDSTNAQ